MKALFLCRIHQFEISDRISGCDKINDSLSITNDTAYLRSMIDEQFQPVIGAMEWDDLFSGSPVAFSKAEIPDDMATKEYLTKKLYQLQSFISSTWLTMDNSINMEIGFLLCDVENGIKAESNLLSTMYTNCRGIIEPKTLTRSELSNMRKFYRDNIQFDDTQDRLTKISKDFERTDRALYMISTARCENDLGLKIANYCTVMEALLSTSQTELSHQIAERLAYFIGTNPDERISIYKSSKKAYNIRSKVVHGDTISANDIQALIPISEFCDQSIRKIFSTLFRDKDLYLKVNDGKQFEELMLNIIMGNQMNVISKAQS